MKKKMNKKTSKKEVILKVDKNYFLTKKNPALTKAAKKVVRVINQHFKKDKWPLDFNFQVEEVFYEAYGEHLSNYLLKEIYASKRNYNLVYKKDKLLISE